MHTHVAPDFWRLHKNMSCAFPLRPDRIISYVNNLYYNLTNEPKLIKRQHRGSAYRMFFVIVILKNWEGSE